MVLRGGFLGTWVTWTYKVGRIPFINFSSHCKATPSVRSQRVALVQAPSSRATSNLLSIGSQVLLPASITRRHKMASNSNSRATSPASEKASSPIRDSKLIKRHHSGSSSGTYMQCGRHSNQWLFHDISIKETAKGFLKRKHSE